MHIRAFRAVLVFKLIRVITLKNVKHCALMSLLMHQLSQIPQYTKVINWFSTMNKCNAHSRKRKVNTFNSTRGLQHCLHTLINNLPVTIDYMLNLRKWNVHNNKSASILYARQNEYVPVSSGWTMPFWPNCRTLMSAISSPFFCDNFLKNFHRFECIS